MSNPVLFSAAGLSARELARDEVPRVQALFDANPEYFQTVNGRRPHADEAAVEFDERPPPHLPYTRHWFLGLFDEQQALAGVVVVVSDLCAAGVWHVALFLLATPLHGSGRAGPVFEALQAWVHGSGAHWLRLVVVHANTRAMRFWARHGFGPLRVHRGFDTGGRLNDATVMVKPLAGGTLEDYLRLVPRDTPGTTLP